MRGLNISSAYTIVTLAIFILIYSSSSFSQNLSVNGTMNNQQVEYSQKWHSNTVDPGMSTGTVVLIGVGVAAVVTAIIIIANSGSDSTDVDSTGEGNDETGAIINKPDDQNNIGVPLSLFHGNLKKIQNRCKKENTPLKVYLSMKQNNFQFSENTFAIGVALNF